MVTWLHCFWSFCEEEHHGGKGVVQESWLTHGIQEAESVEVRRWGKRTGIRYNPQWLTPKDTFPSTRPHLISFHYIPIAYQINPLMSGPSWANQVPKPSLHPTLLYWGPSIHVPLWGTSNLNHNTFISRKGFLKAWLGRVSQIWYNCYLVSNICHGELPIHCRIFSNISTLYSLNASIHISSFPFPTLLTQLWQPKMSLDIAKCPEPLD
jgi:hypothetical protein